MSTTARTHPRTLPGGAGSPARGALRRSADWARRAPLLPALIFIIIVTQLPFVVTLVISFMNWNAYYPDERGFAGLEQLRDRADRRQHARRDRRDDHAHRIVVLVSLVLGLIIALLLDRKFLGRGVVRTHDDHAVPRRAGGRRAVVEARALQPGVRPAQRHAHLDLGLFGSDNPPQPDWITMAPLASIEVALIWQWTPFMMLILLAGLQGRPLDVIEAARIDGASAWQIFRYMTFPHLRQYLELGALLGSIYIVQNFDAVFTITSGGLGTANLPYVIYQTFYLAHDYGLASAAGVVVVIGTILIATFALRTVSSLFREENAR